MGIKFKKQKCKFSLQEVKYIGHIIGKYGIKSDQDKVEAIKIKSPQSPKELSRFFRYDYLLSQICT